jgi:hypothetical protein
VAKWSQGKPDVTLDLHNPTLNARAIYTHALRGTDGNNAEEIARALANSGPLRFLQTLERLQTGPLRFAVKDSLDFAARIRLARPDTEEAERRQRADARDASISIGFEIPYALVGDKPVTPETARAFGRDIAAALASHFKSAH